MKGSQMLKTVSIIMIIFAAISAVITVLALAVAAVAVVAVLGGVTVEGQEAVSASAAILLVISLLAGVVGTVIELIAGIWGVKYCNMPEKAGKCVTVAIVILVIDAVSYVVTFASGGSIGIISMATGLALPILYLVAAKQLQSNATAAPAEDASYTEE